uniref:GT23 domain-containing protein n=1 Tax=Macrostomum lignano TaxID=282301 RepID=A0A1I8J5X1_9PLAT
VISLSLSACCSTLRLSQLNSHATEGGADPVGNFGANQSQPRLHQHQPAAPAMNCHHPAIQHSASPLCHHEASAEAAVAAAAAAAAAAASSLWEPQLPAPVISAATGAGGGGAGGTGGSGGGGGGSGGGAAHCLYPGGPLLGPGPLAMAPGLLAQTYPLHLLQPQQAQLQAAAAAHWQHLPLGAAGGGGAAAAAAAAASGLFGDMLGEQQAAAAAAAAAASCQQLCLMPGFDSMDAELEGPALPALPQLVKWYSEKPPFVLDGRVACLYKMREIDRRLHSMVLSADAEFNTILAEYLVLRQVFGPDYPFIHIYFRDRSDAQLYLDSAQRVGALAPCWCNPKTYSKHNVYITSLPYFLLAKDALCQYIRTFVLPGCGARDPIRRARVDPDKRSAQKRGLPEAGLRPRSPQLHLNFISKPNSAVKY